jgi:hypothetical protein
MMADTLQDLMAKTTPYFHSVPIVQTATYQFADDMLIITEHPQNYLKINTIYSGYLCIDIGPTHKPG